MYSLSGNVYNPPVELPHLTIAPGTAVVIRRARVSDVPRLYELINYNAARDVMLPRPLDYLYNRVREFQAADAGGEVVGGAALKIIWNNLAEIVSIAIHPDFQGRSLGRQLVLMLLEEARALGLSSVCTLTLTPGFFSRLGFREIPRTILHHKIWQDCDLCPKRERCDEVAMTRDIV
jgi:amino-acid N-acetyltransferase